MAEINGSYFRKRKPKSRNKKIRKKLKEHLALAEADIAAGRICSIGELDEYLESVLNEKQED